MPASSLRRFWNCVSPTPTRIFVSQSEICSRLVLTPCVGLPPAAALAAAAAPEAGGAGGLSCRLRGIPNRKPSRAPTAKAPPETIHACPLSATAVQRTFGVFGSRSAVASGQRLTVPTVIASHQSSVRTTAWRLLVAAGSPSGGGEDRNSMDASWSDVSG